MPLSLYDKMSIHFHLVENIHLQGWGEPLLHPEISLMIQKAKDAGCKTSITTNGALLTPELSEELIRQGLNTVAISLAGATKEIHEAIRCGSHFEQLVQNIKTLAAMKEEMRAKTPKIVLSYIMTKGNIKELPEAVILAKGVGADELLAVNVDYVPGQRQDEMRIFSCKEMDAEYTTVIENAMSTAKAAKIALRVYPLITQEVIMCEMNPLKIISLSYDGCVSPCIYLNLPKKGLIPRIFCGRYHEVEKTCFGNIRSDNFIEIWERRAYEEFRASYVKRITLNAQAFNVIGEAQSSNAAMNELDHLEAKLREYPLPSVCRTCYKSYNI